MDGIERLSDYFKHNILSFRYTGIWVNLFDLRRASLVVIVYSVTVNFFFMMSPQVCHVIYMYKARHNVQAFADEFYVSLASLLVVFKSYSLLKNFDTIKNLLDVMDSHTFQGKNTHQIRQIQQVMGTWKKTYWLYATFVVSFVFLKLATTIVDTILSGSKVLPLVDCYPFNVHISPTYEFMFLYQSIALSWLVIQNFNLDTFITGLLIVAAVQCDVLCDDLENLNPRKMQYQEDGKNDIMDKKIVECIKHHQEIRGFVNDVSNCFSVNIFQQFSCSVVTICATMFEFSTKEPLSQEFFAVIVYQLSIFLQLFIFCWTGTELTEKSKRIPISLYESDWVGTSRAFRSNLLIFLQNVQRPFQIVALIFPVCVEMFLQIVKSSFSYYTMLMSLNEE